MKLTVYFADERSKKLICKDHAMYLINHNYELDWLVAWLITERYGILAVSWIFWFKLEKKNICFMFV